jgi:hypothetical protein
MMLLDGETVWRWGVIGMDGSERASLSFFRGEFEATAAAAAKKEERFGAAQSGQKSFVGIQYHQQTIRRA